MRGKGEGQATASGAEAPGPVDKAPVGSGPRLSEEAADVLAEQLRSRLLLRGKRAEAVDTASVRPAEPAGPPPVKEEGQGRREHGRSSRGEGDEEQAAKTLPLALREVGRFRASSPQAARALRPPHLARAVAGWLLGELGGVQGRGCEAFPAALEPVLPGPRLHSSEGDQGPAQ